MAKIILGYKGSATSGNMGHAGRPGKVGGSAPKNFSQGMAAYNTINNSLTLAPITSAVGNVIGNLDPNTLNRVGMQSLIDYAQGFISANDLINLLSDPRALKGTPVKSYMTPQWLLQNPSNYTPFNPPPIPAQVLAGSPTPAPGTNAAGVVPNDYDPWQDLKDLGFIVPDKNNPGQDHVLAGHRWVYTVGDTVDPYGKQAIADFKAGKITEDQLHGALAPAWRDIQGGQLLVHPNDDAITIAGKRDFSDMYQSFIEGAQTRADLKQTRERGGAWVSQVGIVSMTPQQWEKVSWYRKGLVTEDELKLHIAPQTLKALPPVMAPPTPAKPANVSLTHSAIYTDPKQLPCMAKIDNRQVTDQAYDSKGNMVSGDGILQAIVKDQGYDGKPHIVTKAEMSHYEKAGEIVIYRGTSSGRPASHRAARYKEFREGDFFQGYGMHGNGTYASTDMKTARQYAGNTYGSKTDAAVMKMTIKADARIIEKSKLEALQSKYYNQVSQPFAGTKGEREIASDLGRFAAALGYDAIKVPNQSYSGGREDFFVVLNRTALRVLDQDV